MKYPTRLRFASVPIACAIFAMGVAIAATRADTSAARYRDDSNGQDWPGYGRTFGQQHYSPLTQIDQKSIHRLGLAWSLELGPENSATQPIAVDGVLYFAIGLSVVHAVDARSGKLLWRYDPEVASKAGRALRIGWGVRGIAWWKGRIYSGSQDGRLIALDARTGKPAWSVQAVESDSGYCNGAPHAFDDKVIIGCTTPRGVVTAYAARIGKQIWRFYTVPGNPADGFENETMEKAAATWAGEWWRSGGGGSVWNAISYDAETSTVYVGSGSGRPWNRRERSADQGDNLFLASIVELDGRTGRYKWH